MRFLAMVFILIGLYMTYKGSWYWEKKNTIANYGNAQVVNYERKDIVFPWYAGPIACITGIVLFIAYKKRDE